MLFLYCIFEMSLRHRIKINIMKTLKKLKYVEDLLKASNCPPSEITPYAVQILTDCKINNKSIYDLQIIK